MIPGEARQTLLKLADDASHARKNTVGKLLLPEFVPEGFLRIELRRIWGQPKEADVFGHHQCFGDVGTRSINHHEQELLGMRRAALRQKFAPLSGVHLGSEQPVELPCSRADGALDIGALPLATIVHHGAGRGRGPATAEAHHPAKARLVLEEQPHPPPLDLLRVQQGCQCFGEFFSSPPVRRGCSWGAVCPARLYASRDAPAVGRSATL